MSHLEIRHGEFPKAIPNHLAVGDYHRLVVTGRIRRIEDELIDVTAIGEPIRVAAGERTTELLITGIEVAPPEPWPGEQPTRELR